MSDHERIAGMMQDAGVGQPRLCVDCGVLLDPDPDGLLGRCEPCAEREMAKLEGGDA